MVTCSTPYVMRCRGSRARPLDPGLAASFGIVERSIMFHAHGSHVPAPCRHRRIGGLTCARPRPPRIPVHPLLAERWSPRGFDRHHQVGDGQVTALLEAARWAPSAANSQPWRFLVTRRGEDAHGRALRRRSPPVTRPGRTPPAPSSSSRPAPPPTRKPQPWALYDTGQAVALLVTQAQAQGLAVHQMGRLRRRSHPARLRPGPRTLPRGGPRGRAGRPRTPSFPATSPPVSRPLRTRQPVSDLLLP